jgi:hypothetical protein
MVNQVNKNTMIQNIHRPAITTGYHGCKKQLLINEIAASTPEVSHSYDPQYPIWKREFERFEVTSETILVGHSCGGGFLVRWLSENKEARAKSRPSCSLA